MAGIRKRDAGDGRLIGAGDLEHRRRARGQQVGADISGAADLRERDRGGAAAYLATEQDRIVRVGLQQVRADPPRFGKLDILYNNVGGSTTRDGPVTTAPAEEFWSKMKMDVFGTWLGCRHAIPHMVRGGGGSIVNATSMCALMGTPNKDAYTAAKGAVAALTRSMAVEYAPQKIRVNAVAPAATRTARVIRLLAEHGVTAAIADTYLLGLVEPIDVA